jgi:hypothetical protein
MRPRLDPCNTVASNWSTESAKVSSVRDISVFKGKLRQQFGVPCWEPERSNRAAALRAFARAVCTRARVAAISRVAS